MVRHKKYHQFQKSSSGNLWPHERCEKRWGSLKIKLTKRCYHVCCDPLICSKPQGCQLSRRPKEKWLGKWSWSLTNHHYNEFDVGKDKIKSTENSNTCTDGIQPCTQKNLVIKNKVTMKMITIVTTWWTNDPCKWRNNSHLGRSFLHLNFICRWNSDVFHQHCECWQWYCKQ